MPNPDVSAAWSPRIVAFVCKWCTYAGADLAGTMRREYSADVRVIRFPCTGRIEPPFLLKAFEAGADGVLVSGCHPGDCHYRSGNYHARRRWTVFPAFLDFVGFDLRRLRLAWVSASEAGKWVDLVNDFAETIRALGPHAEYPSLKESFREKSASLLDAYVDNALCIAAANETKSGAKE